MRRGLGSAPVADGAELHCNNAGVPAWFHSGSKSGCCRGRAGGQTNETVQRNRPTKQTNETGPQMKKRPVGAFRSGQWYRSLLPASVRVGFEDNLAEEYCRQKCRLCPMRLRSSHGLPSNRAFWPAVTQHDAILLI